MQLLDYHAIKDEVQRGAAAAMKVLRVWVDIISYIYIDWYIYIYMLYGIRIYRVYIEYRCSIDVE